jgi:hypothetical protein
VGILQQRTSEQVRSDVLIIDDLEGFHTRKLGRLNFENSLGEKLVLTESTGIERSVGNLLQSQVKQVTPPLQDSFLQRLVRNADQL